jgi:hypothetical protein
VERTYQKLRSNYFMKGATGIIKDYIQHCPACLINKPVNYTPSGKLIPITAPSSPWELVTMDFVVKLPPCSPSNGLWAKLTGKPDLPTYDSFLTITDKLTKYVVLVPGCESWSAEMWAQAYFDCVFPTFGVPAATKFRQRIGVRVPVLDHDIQPNEDRLYSHYRLQPAV